MNDADRFRLCFSPYRMRHFTYDKVRRKMG